MPDFREASPGAAYLIADDVTCAEDAEAFALIVVETDAIGRPSAWGRYKLEGEVFEPAKPVKTK
jgi:hypothetical protein